MEISLSSLQLVRRASVDLRQAWYALASSNRWAVAVLLVSGIAHIPLLLLSEMAWDEPASFRKPILFGISTGFTLWSCLWVLGKLRPHRWEAAAATLLSGSLVVEVALITGQAWRGTRSHFNREGLFNSSIELLMLILIVTATAIITWIWVRTFSECGLSRAIPPESSVFSPAMRLAVCNGMLLLVVSCLLGFMITAIGKSVQQQGLAPELFGQRGVLKFPHGAALHAIQTLVVLAWFCGVIEQRRSWLCITAAIVAHFAWLIYALSQTFRGKSRWELDAISYLWLAITIAATIITIGMLIATLLKMLSNRSASDQLPNAS